jgi:hypothetical protein
MISAHDHTEMIQVPKKGYISKHSVWYSIGKVPLKRKITWLSHPHHAEDETHPARLPDFGGPAARLAL